MSQTTRKCQVQYAAIILSIGGALGLIILGQLTSFQTGKPQYNWKFEDVTQQSGLGHIVHHKPVFDKKVKNIMPWLSSMGASVAVADYNRDGLMDFYLTDSGPGDEGHLFKNVGGMRFKEIPSSESGIIAPNINSATTDALWFDYLNNGWPDLYLVKWGCNQLFRNNGDGTFTDVTKKAGVGYCGYGMKAIALDYNRDGCPDLYIANYFRPNINLWNLSTTKIMNNDFENARNGGPNVLYRNNCNGTFTDVSAQAGVADTGWSLDTASADVNGDGWPDIFGANDFGTNKLFLNNHDGTFSDGSARSIGIDTKKSMNAEFADITGDGCPDLYVTAVTKPGYLTEGNSLWINRCDGTGRFYDIAREAGVWDGGWGWAGKMKDFNNDGLTDIFTVNGFISAGKGDYWFKLGTMATTPGLVIEDAANWPSIGNDSLSGYEKKRLFLNEGNLKFTDVAEKVGINETSDGRGVAVADFDNNGALDILIANQGQHPILYKNDLNLGNSWVEFQLTGKSPSTTATGRCCWSTADAIGARVKVTAGGHTWYGWRDGGDGFASQSDPRIHIGLGKSTHIDSVEIVWPSGRMQVLHNLDVNHIYHLYEG